MNGKSISHYHLIEKIGEGGMGMVFKAEDTLLCRTVALKFLPHYFSSSADDKKRFRIEAQAAASLNHPNVTQIYSIEETEDEMFIVMEYIEGKELEDVINENDGGIENIQQIINYAMQIADGLEAAHSKGIIHRDIKSRNIMVTREGHIKIMDFGLAKIQDESRFTRTGTRLGTTAYMSPEQARGEEVDKSADIWSFGVVLYEMITGRMPFKGEFEQAVLYSVLTDDPEYVSKLRKGVPAELENLTTKCLNKNRLKRLNSITAAKEILIGISDELRTGTSRTAPLLKPGRKTERLLLKLLPVILLIPVIIFLISYFSRLEGPVSVALLPVQNISGSIEEDWFTDGMTDALITNLARIGGLRVISRSSIMKYKGSLKNPSEIAKELGVTYIVETSVLKFNDQVKFSTRLIEASSDKYIWAREYQRSLSNVMFLQSEIAKSVAEEIEVKLTPSEESLLAVKHEIIPEAYESYLKGNFYMYKLTPQALDIALQYYTRAVEIDPLCAPAHAGIAFVWLGRAQSGFESMLDAYKEAEFSIRKALEMDSTLAETHYIMASVKTWGEWDWETAVEHFSRALYLNPNYTEAHAYYSHLLFILKRKELGLSEMEIAAGLDPFNMLVKGLHGMSLMYAKDYGKAAEVLEDARRISPRELIILSTLRSVYHQMGKYDKAIEIWRESFELRRDQEAIGELNSGYKSGGYAEALRALAALLIARSETHFVTPWQIATLYTRSGDKDKALDWLEKALDARDPNIPYLSIDPIFDNLRTEERFIKIIRRIGL